MISRWGSLTCGFNVQIDKLYTIVLTMPSTSAHTKKHSNSYTVIHYLDILYFLLILYPFFNLWNNNNNNNNSSSSSSSNSNKKKHTHLFSRDILGQATRSHWSIAGTAEVLPWQGGFWGLGFGAFRVWWFGVCLAESVEVAMFLERADQRDRCKTWQKR